MTCDKKPGMSDYNYCFDFDDDRSNLGRWCPAPMLLHWTIQQQYTTIKTTSKMLLFPIGIKPLSSSSSRSSSSSSQSLSLLPPTVTITSWSAYFINMQTIISFSFPPPPLVFSTLLYMKVIFPFFGFRFLKTFTELIDEIISVMVFFKLE